MVYLGVGEGVSEESRQPRQKSEEGARCAKVGNDHGTGQRTEKEKEKISPDVYCRYTALLTKMMSHFFEQVS